MPASAGLLKRREGRKRDRMSYLSGAHFRNFIRDLLRSMNGEASITDEAKSIVDNIVQSMYQEIADEALRLMVLAGRRTLSAWDVQSAVLINLPGEIALHAIAEGRKAVDNYNGVE